MEEEAAGTELSLDAQLESLFNPGAAAPESGKKDAPGKQPAAVSSPQQAEVPAGDGEADPLEDALKEIEEDKPEEKPVVPEMTNDQKAILAAIPNAEVATQLYSTVQNYNNFTGAFESRDFEKVNGMFETWDKDAYDAFKDYIYDKHVASGEWVDRFIAEQEGRGGQHKTTKAMEKKIADLQAKVDNIGKPPPVNVQAEAEKKAFGEYTAHIESLFEKINFSAADRRWVVADLNNRVAADAKVLAALKAGNPNAANALFKQAVRDYANRDKEVSTDKNDKIKLQTNKKLIVGGGGNQQGTDELPDDVKYVPKGKEDSWMDQQLAKLARKAGLGKK